MFGGMMRGFGAVTARAGFVAVLVLAATFGVAFTAGGSASAAPVGVKSARAVVPPPSVTEKGMCDVLAHLPGYSYRYQGATVTVPSGARLLKELTADGVTGSTRQRACKAMVGDYGAHN